MQNFLTHTRYMDEINQKEREKKIEKKHEQQQNKIQLQMK